MTPFTDLVRSVFLGPLRLAIPIIGYLAVYALLARQHGAVVLGVWVLLSSFTAVVAIVETGLVPYLTRRILERDKSDHAAMTFEEEAQCLTSVVVVIAGVALCGHVAFAIGKEVWPSEISNEALVASALTVIGTLIQIVARLRSPIVIASNYNSYVVVCAAASQFIFFCVAALGSVLGTPLAGLGIGAVLQGAAMLVLMRGAPASVPNTQANARSNTDHFADRFRHGLHLLWSSRHFLALSAGLSMRQPIARVSLAAAGGFEAVAVFEAALRLTVGIRELITGGFTALFPFLVRVKHLGDPALTVSICKTGLMVIVATTASAYASTALFLDVLVRVWLGSEPDHFIGSALVLFLWGFITGVNLVFWYLLQAYSFERYAAHAALVHSVLLLGLIPLAHIVAINSLIASYYWLGTSLATQAYIYFRVHQKTQLLFATFRDPKVLVIGAGGLLVMILAFDGVSYALAPVLPLVAVLTAVATYLLVACMTVFRPIARLYADLRAG